MFTLLGNPRMTWLPKPHFILLPLLITAALLSIKTAAHSSKGFSSGHHLVMPSLHKLDDENSTSGTNGAEQYEYALVVDAGSSGSRIYVFRIASSQTQNQNRNTSHDLSIKSPRVEIVRDSTNHAASHKVSLTYLLEYSPGCTCTVVLSKVKNGLHTFHSNLNAIRNYIKNLTEYGLRFVPQKHRQRTKLYLLATVSHLL